MDKAPQAKTIDEFCRDWRIGRTNVYNLAKQGKLRLTKIGKSTRILAADEAAFAESLKSDKTTVTADAPPAATSVRCGPALTAG